MRHNFQRHAVEQKLGAIMFGVSVFKVVRAHVVGAAAIYHADMLRAQANGLRDGVNSGVAATNHNHALANRNFFKRLTVKALDERQCIENFRQVFARNSQIVSSAQANRNKNRFKITL